MILKNNQYPKYGKNCLNTSEIIFQTYFENRGGHLFTACLDWLTVFYMNFLLSVQNPTILFMLV